MSNLSRPRLFQAMMLPILAACIFNLALGAATAAVGVDSLSVVATITVGTDPQFLAVTPDGSTVYVGNYYSSTISVIDTATNTVSTTIAVGSRGGPLDIAITPDGSTIFLRSLNPKISVISTATNSVVNMISPGPSFATGLAISPNGKKLFVSNFYGTVSIIDVATYKIDKTLNVGYNTWSVVMAPDGNSAYVEAANMGPFYVTKIDVASQTIVKPQIGAGKITKGISTFMAISPDSRTIYVAENEKDVLAFNATTGALERKIVLFSETGNRSKYDLTGLQVSADGKSLYVAESGAHAVSTIDTVTGKQVGTPLAVGKQPYGMALSPDGQYLYVANLSSGTVSVILIGS